MTFSGVGSFSGYRYPLTATVLQLLGVVIILVCWNASGKKFPFHQSLPTSQEPVYKTSDGEETCLLDLNSVPTDIPNSWFGGAHFLRKTWTILPVGILYACVMGFSNVGLSSVPANLHLILRSTSLIWIVLFSLFSRQVHERASWREILCCFTLVGGVILVSYDEHEGIEGPPGLALAYNLFSALATGIMIVVMRSICLRLMSPPFFMDVVEITLFKMTIALIILIPIALGYECGYLSPSSLEELGQNSMTWGFVAGGIIITGLFQSLVVALTSVFRSTAVGVIQDACLLPQIALFALLDPYLPERFHIVQFSGETMHICGLILVLLSTLSFSILRLFERYRSRDVANTGAFSVDSSINRFVRKSDYQESSLLVEER